MATRNHVQRREAIAEAAWSCFLQHGFAKTSLEDVARRAGVSRPLIYLHFPSKQELFSHVVLGVMDRVFDEAKQVVGLNLDRKTKLLRVVEIWLLEPLERLTASPLGNELFEEALGVSPEVEQRHRERTRELLTAVIGDATAAEVFSLAVGGLKIDQPSIETLRGRMRVLTERFVA